jgi:hypothetical protein
MSSPSPSDLGSNESLESLESRASEAQTSGYLYTIAACGIAIVLSRFVPSAQRFAPLAIAAPFGAYLDWKTGEDRAGPIREELKKRKAAEQSSGPKRLS